MADVRAEIEAEVLHQEAVAFLDVFAVPDDVEQRVDQLRIVDPDAVGADFLVDREDRGFSLERLAVARLFYLLAIGPEPRATFR